MEYTLSTAIQNRLAKTGESPESFINRAVDALIRREMAQGWNDLPRESVIDVVPLSGLILLLTFADGDRRLFNGKILKGKENFKNIHSEVDFTCARVEGYTVVWEDKDGIFNELPPGYLYENSVSLMTFVHSLLVRDGLRKSGRAAEPTLDEDDLRKMVFLPDEFVKASDPEAIKAESSPLQKKRSTATERKLSRLLSLRNLCR